MQWVILFVAGCFEISWATAMKYSDGFTNLWPSVATVVLQIASFICLGLALKQLPLGTAYAIWTGIGMVGTFIMGVLLFKEVVTVPQVICVAMIVTGIVGLRLLAN